MNKEVVEWFSPSLNKQMEVAIYGHYGFALLMIPTAASGYLEYEQKGLIGAIEGLINEGKVKVFSINSINSESWLNPYMSGHDKGVRHQQFNEYVIKEVVPFIKDQNGADSPIYLAGASFGALHSANLFFKHPDLFNGFIGMSGCYDLSAYTKGHFDDNVYFNSPAHYLKNLNAEWHLAEYRKSRHIHLISGSGAYEEPESSRYISDLLNQKSVNHTLDIWGEDIPHDWWAWHRMLPYYLETKF